MLSIRCGVGDPLPPALFQPVADIVVAARLVQEGVWTG